MREALLMSHVIFGVLAVLAALWVFVDTLNAGEDNVHRVRTAALVCAALIWLSYIAGGYWYVVHYGADKALIKAGPWPFAHSLMMETKEHVFFTLLLLATYLPIAAAPARLLASRPARNLVLAVSGLVVLMGLAMEGFGGAVSAGLRVALMDG